MISPYISSRGFHTCQKPGFYGGHKLNLSLNDSSTSRNTNFVIFQYTSSRDFQMCHKSGSMDGKKKKKNYLLDIFPAHRTQTLWYFSTSARRVSTFVKSLGSTDVKKELFLTWNSPPHGTQTLWYLPTSAREVFSLDKSLGSTHVKKELFLTSITPPHGSQTLWYISTSGLEFSKLVKSLGFTEVKKELFLTRIPTLTEHKLCDISLYQLGRFPHLSEAWVLRTSKNNYSILEFPPLHGAQAS